MNELQSLCDLFENRLFRIPNYQRGYAWQETQLHDFFKDAQILPKGKNHYTGVLSLKAINDKEHEKWHNERWLFKHCSPFHIVDGQQRLTTCVIFIQAVIEFFEKHNPNIKLGDKSLTEIKAYYLYQKDPQNISTAYKFGYEVDNPSFNFLKQTIFHCEENGNSKETFYTANLERAKVFFTDKIKDISEENGESAVIDLFDKITNHFLFNVYEISDDFNVFVAFETMNNRGKKLSHLELLKNRILYLISLYDNKNDTLLLDNQINLTKTVNDAWSEIYHQLGRNKDKPLNDDEFLRAYWIVYFDYTKKKGSDYIDYFLNKKFTADSVYQYNENNNTGLNPTDLKNCVNNLKVLSQYWYNIHFPTDCQNHSSNEKLWLDKLNRLGFMYFRPLVVSLFLKNSGLNANDRVSILKQIERFIFVHFRLNRKQSNSGESPFYNLAHQIACEHKGREENSEENNEENIQKKLVEKITNQLNDTLNPNKQSPVFKTEIFMDYITNKTQGFYDWNGLKYFLYEYEYSLFAKNGDEKIQWKSFVKPDEKDKVSIEHIYPQHPKDEDWQDFKDYSDDEKRRLRGSLGNLLPLSLSINSSLQNSSFEEKKSQKFDENGEEKRRGYRQGSHSEVEVSKYNKWTAHEIKSRGLALLAFLESRWNISVGNDEMKSALLGLTFLDKKTDEQDKHEQS
ncbi:MAG: DUF262 domain-containing HNH endonuclease family protein [Acinetobacter sp.]|nr:DUF262 domain-containing HNH endonuclease family protein [Acinetobacter sp.]